MRSAGVPFGLGVGHCMGVRIAQMERTLILARLARRLLPISTSPVLVRPDGMAVHQPPGGVPIRLRPRPRSNVERVSPT